MDKMVLADQVLRLLEIEGGLSACLAGSLRHADGTRRRDGIEATAHQANDKRKPSSAGRKCG
jgi:hypothetical protein